MHSGKDLFTQDLKSVEGNLDYFVSSKMLDGVPVVWNEKSMEFIRWRHLVGEKLNVNALNVLVVGSARLGYSLNPEKDFKKFNEESDIDVAIVSQELFEKSWDEILALFDIQAITGEAKGRVRGLLVDKCIPLDLILPNLSFGKKWLKVKTELVEKIGFNFLSNEINYRIYRDYESLSKYQKKSLIAAKNKLEV